MKSEEKTMIDEKRLAAEIEVFRKKKLSPSWFRFLDIGTDHPCLKMAAKTNSGNWYTIHIDLKYFPESVPNVYVTSDLRDDTGESLIQTSAQMHVLSSNREGWTRICYYSYSAWTPNVSLYKIYVKICLWLNVYEFSKQNGKPIDTYLPHQK